MIQWSQKNFSELTKEELYAILKHRMEIFILEQKSFYLDLDNMDQQATHFLGEEEGKLIAYARVYIDSLHALAKIRRVAIHKDFRKKQLGTLLLIKMLDFIGSLPNITAIELDAQHHLQQFYARHGFLPVGEPYHDGGILHINMVKNHEET